VTPKDAPGTGALPKCPSSALSGNIRELTLSLFPSTVALWARSITVDGKSAETKYHFKWRDGNIVSGMKKHKMS
jgi:hypothetical protein